jgi:hypothetical protein
MTDDQLKQEIERAATSLLNDEEICKTLNITATVLKKHYDVVETARIKLKQKLNAKKISDAANGMGDVNGIIDLIPNLKNVEKKPGKHGGARPGGGRKPGTTNKISGASILDSVEKYAGEKFEDLLAQGYVDSIKQRDKSTRLQYEKMFLSKVVADKQEIDHTTLGQSLHNNFTFPTIELNDWQQNIPKIISTK